MDGFHCDVANLWASNAPALICLASSFAGLVPAERHQSIYAAVADACRHLPRNLNCQRIRDPRTRNRSAPAIDLSQSLFREDYSIFERGLKVFFPILRGELAQILRGPKRAAQP